MHAGEILGCLEAWLTSLIETWLGLIKGWGKIVKETVDDLEAMVPDSDNPQGVFLNQTTTRGC